MWSVRAEKIEIGKTGALSAVQPGFTEEKRTMLRLYSSTRSSNLCLRVQPVMELIFNSSILTSIVGNQDLIKHLEKFVGFPSELGDVRIGDGGRFSRTGARCGFGAGAYCICDGHRGSCHGWICGWTAGSPGGLRGTSLRISPCQGTGERRTVVGVGGVIVSPKV